MKKIATATIVIFSLFLISCNSEIETSSLKSSTFKSLIDKDMDGIDDYTDIVQSARAQIGVVTKYDINYYSNAFPPEDSGACSDLLWRSFEGAGYNFKEMIDEDIKNNPQLYPSNPIPDTNINFRRVRNIKIFLENNAESLTTEFLSENTENVGEWYGGDIVTFEQIPGGLWHTAIISDKKKSGVPLLIHNYGHGVVEDDYLLKWPTEISGHFRFNLN